MEHFRVLYFVSYISSYPFIHVLKWLVMKALFLMSVLPKVLIQLMKNRISG